MNNWCSKAKSGVQWRVVKNHRKFCSEKSFIFSGILHVTSSVKFKKIFLEPSCIWLCSGKCFRECDSEIWPAEQPPNIWLEMVSRGWGGLRGMVVTVWGRCAMWEDGTSPTCCGFSLLQGCCFGRNRRVQPEVCMHTQSQPHAQTLSFFLYLFPVQSTYISIFRNIYW